MDFDLLFKATKKILEENRTVFENFSYLSAVQAINILIPLFTYGYLIRVIGSQNYGLIVFAQSIISYLAIFVSFGFSFSATKEISIHRDDREKLSEIVSSVLIIKTTLLSVTFFILFAFLEVNQESDGMKLVFILSMWVCVYEGLMPTWYFQGVEQMKYIVYLNLLSKTIFAALIFEFVRGSADYIIIPVLNGIGTLIACIGGLYIIFRRHGISFRKQKPDVLKKYINQSFELFLSNACVKIYDGTSKVLIGTYFGLSQVAYYDLAEKLSNLFKTPTQIVGQALFPRVVSKKSSVYLSKALFFVLPVSLFIIIFAITLSDSIIQIVGGDEMLPAVEIFVILIGSILPVTISLFYANLTLLAFGFHREFLYLRLISVLSYGLMIVLLLCINMLTISKIAIITVITECCVALLAIIFCNMKSINFIRHNF